MNPNLTSGTPLAKQKGNIDVTTTIAMKRNLNGYMKKYL